MRTLSGVGWLPLAAGEAPAWLAEVAGLVVGAAVVAYLAFRAGLVPIVGFLLAGVLIGPNQLGIIADRELVDAAAEVGVILLLFTIGLEFSLDRLLRIRRVIFLAGGLQVVLATGLSAAVLTAAGVESRTALYTGLLVSLSSTAIVLKLLADRSETNARHGQVALGILLFQDLAVVLMVLLVPMLGGDAGSAGDFVVALGTAGAIIAGVVLVARRLMPRLLEVVARTCSPEVFLLTVVAVCFGTAYGTSLAGVSVSLGAFLAGLLVSESRFDQQALGEILPLQIVFSALFFVSIGMLLDLGYLVDNMAAVIGAILAVLVVKAITAGVAARALGESFAVAAASGLLLAQVGEFSFVLERAGSDVGLSPAGLGADGSQGFIAAAVLLLVATPWLAQGGVRFGGRMAPALAAPRAPQGTEPEAGSGVAEGLDGHVIIAGYGRVARVLATALVRGGVPHVVTTLSPDGADEAQRRGLRVLLGDSSRTRTMEEAGIRRARFVVIADDEPDMATRIAGVARALNPEAKVVVRTRYHSDTGDVKAAGATLRAERRDRRHGDAVGEAAHPLRRGAGADRGAPLQPPRSRARSRDADAAAVRAHGGRHRAPRRPRLRPRGVRACRRHARGRAQRSRLRGVPARRHRLGAPAAVHGVRPRRLLRLEPQPPWPAPLGGHRPRDHPLRRARRAVGPLLPRRPATRTRRNAGVTAVIFDCDGTLVDSEPLSRTAWERALEPYGYVITDADAEASVGLPYPRVHAFFAERAALPGADEFWTELSAELYELIDADLEPFDDAVNAARELRARGVPVAVASSSFRDRLHRTLSRAGLLDAFDAVVAGDEVEHGKPAPDMFLLAAERLGVEPAACVVVEDSPPGVQAGLAAGMITLAVCRVPGTEATLAGAHRVLDTVSADTILRSPRSP